jgi:hypothetical protein
MPWLEVRRFARSSDNSAEESGVVLLASASTRNFLFGSVIVHMTFLYVTNFLRRLSVTTHSTWSKRQLVQGEPFSTTSQRTLRARQQQQARDALRLIGRFAADRPAAEAFRLFCDDAVSGGGEEVVEAIVSEHREGVTGRRAIKDSKGVHINAKPIPLAQ